MICAGPIITLTTDFGDADGYVGAVKGVIYSICAEARVIDIAHHIAPQNVGQAALTLEAAVAYYPPGTVHLAVVDPGVGTARRRIAVVTDSAYLVGPDNGIFSLVFRRQPPQRIIAIENKKLMLPGPATTFDGRDIFAPAAAYLANGLDPAELGPEIDDPIALDWPENIRDENEIIGAVVNIDRFGNLVTSIRGEDLPEDVVSFVVRIKDRQIKGPSLSYYDNDATETSDICKAVFGSSGYLEISRPGDSASELLSARCGEAVQVNWKDRNDNRSRQ